MNLDIDKNKFNSSLKSIVEKQEALDWGIKLILNVEF